MNRIDAQELLRGYGYRLQSDPTILERGYQCQGEPVLLIIERLIDDEELHLDLCNLHGKVDLMVDIQVNRFDDGTDIAVHIGSAFPIESNLPMHDDQRVAYQQMGALQQAVYGEQCMLYRWLYGDDIG